MPAQIPVRVTYSGADATGLAELAPGDYLAATLGGTGQTVYVVGDILYANATTTLARLPAGTLGQPLTMGATAPQWGGDVVAGLVRQSTADGADNSVLIVTGGGASSVSRGGRIFMYGNEHATFPGQVVLDPGQVTGGHIVFRSGAGTERGRVTDGGVLAWGTTVVTGAAAGDIVLANSKSLRGVNAAGTGTLPLVYVDGSNRTLLWTNSAELVIGDALTQTTVGAAGGASALPASPTGYLRIRIGASQLVVPYYAQA